MGLVDFVRGVVSRESPSSWPIEALKAQAVAARTYAITTTSPATASSATPSRSQVYGGVAARPVDRRGGRRDRREVVTY